MLASLLRTGLPLLLIALATLPAVAQMPSQKRPPPQPTAVQQIEQNLNDVFMLTKVRQSKQASEKRKLAATLYQTAQETPEVSDEKYVLLDEAVRLAAAAADLDQARQAIAALDRDFEIDRAALQHEALETSLAVPAVATARREQIQQGLQWVDAAIAAEQFEAAGKLSALLVKATPKAGDRDLTKAVIEQRARGGEQFKEFKQVQPALEVLANNPVDPASNTTAGRYYCLRRNDWQRGISMLALGNDEKLAEIAAIELKDPTDAAEQIQLADLWWDYAEKLPAADQLPTRKHAADWYSKAATRATGLAATKARQRAAEVYAASQGGVLYLDDLPITEAWVGHGSLGLRGQAGYDVGDGTEVLRFRGEPVPHALSTHAGDGRPALVEIELPVEMIRLETILSLGKNPDSPVTFRVLGDGHELFRSPPMTRRGIELPCRVSLAGVRKLRLEVHAAGGAGNSWAYWFEPRLFVKTDKK